MRKTCEYHEKFACTTGPRCEEPAVDFVEMATSSSDPEEQAKLRQMWLCAKHYDGWQCMLRTVRELRDEGDGGPNEWNR